MYFHRSQMDTKNLSNIELQILHCLGARDLSSFQVLKSIKGIRSLGKICILLKELERKRLISFYMKNVDDMDLKFYYSITPS